MSSADSQELKCTGVEVNKAIDALIEFNPSCQKIVQDYSEKVDALASCDERNPECLKMGNDLKACNQELDKCKSDLDVYVKTGGSPTDWGTVAVVGAGSFIAGWWWRGRKDRRGAIGGPKEMFDTGKEEGYTPPFDFSALKKKLRRKKK